MPAALRAEDAGGEVDGVGLSRLQSCLRSLRHLTAFVLRLHYSMTSASAHGVGKSHSWKGLARSSGPTSAGKLQGGGTSTSRGTLFEVWAALIVNYVFHRASHPLPASLQLPGTSATRAPVLRPLLGYLKRLSLASGQLPLMLNMDLPCTEHLVPP